MIGKPVDGWPGESWLDVRRPARLAEPLGRRLDTCRDKGFDAVEPDNVDAYSTDSGFPLTEDDQLRFNRWTAEQVHARGMGVALKNDPDQVEALVGDVDFAVVESCLTYEECDAYGPFLDAGKAVLHVEYTDAGPTDARCAVPGFSSIRKNRDLDAWRRAC
nr:endo alpha-1,4 polygalactosaminidase [Frankia sp. ArI3]